MIFALSLLGGCLDLEELFAGVTSDHFAEATVLGLSAPAGMELTGTRYEDGARAGVYLASISGEPIDAVMGLRSPSNGDIALEPQGDGSWITPGLIYTVGETYTVLRDGAEVLQAPAVGPPTFAVPATHASGTGITIDLGDQGFERALVTILDLETGEEVWDNVPDDISAAMLEMNEEDPLYVDVPADVFAEPGAYAIGVAGLTPSTPADVQDLNTLVSIMATGVMVLQPMQVTGQ